jgi:membrane protease subunit HflK
MKWKLAILAILLASAAALVVATGWCMVAPGEVVVVRRLGRLVEPPLSPGLHWRYPFGIDRLDRVRTDAVRQVTIGLAGTAGADLEPSAGEVMTGDLNLLRIQATVQYRVVSPADFVLQSSQVEPLLTISAEASVSRALAARGVDAVLRSERQACAHAVEQDLQAAVDRYRLGVAILGVSLTDARPPFEVQADFAAAQSAESERDRRINEANSYEETTVTAARSSGLAKLESARAAALRRTVMARAEAQRFLTLLAEADRSRALTMHRLYVESLRTLLGRVKTKLILPPGDAIDLTVLGAPRESSRPAPKPAGPGQLPVPDRALPRAVEK